MQPFQQYEPPQQQPRCQDLSPLPEPPPFCPLAAAGFAGSRCVKRRLLRRAPVDGDIFQNSVVALNSMCAGSSPACTNSPTAAQSEVLQSLRRSAQRLGPPPDGMAGPVTSPPSTWTRLLFLRTASHRCRWRSWRRSVAGRLSRVSSLRFCLTMLPPRYGTRVESEESIRTPRYVAPAATPRWCDACKRPA